MAEASNLFIDPREIDNSYRDAKAYHANAVKLTQKEEPSYSSAVDIASMALENYLITLCYMNGERPYDHNYTALICAIDDLMDFPEELSAEIQSFDEMFGIRSMDDYRHGEPTAADAEKILDICERVNAIIEPLYNQKNKGQGSVH
ncbi:MAG: HEPN domain-containing protein [Clostridiales bacterium]|nr:HEPN domain-containing protein [Clostridiales bacterium]